MEITSCSVCLELPENTIKCPGCKNTDNTLCKSCYKNIIKTNITNPCCPFCKSLYTDSFIVKTINKRFLDNITEKRNQIVFDQQYALITNEKINYETIKEMHDKRVKRDELRDKIAEMENIRAECELLSDEIYNYSLRTKTPSPIIPLNCPKCDGIVIPESESCAKCHIDVCMKCGKKIPFSTVHRCKQSDINTLKVLRENTKNCPKCATMIYKIDGCDQMFCTVCHTAFSWNTLNIITTTIHNPHYFELVRKGVIKETDNNNTIDYGKLIGMCQRLKKKDDINYFFRLLEAIFRMLQPPSLEDTLIKLNNLDIAFKQFRDEYILKVINKSTFEEDIKNALKWQRTLEMHQQYGNLVVNICQSCLEDINNEDDAMIALKKLQKTEKQIYKLEKKFTQECELNLLVCDNSIFTDFRYLFNIVPQLI